MEIKINRTAEMTSLKMPRKEDQVCLFVKVEST